MNAITQITKEPNFFEDWTAARKMLLPAIQRFNGFYNENDVIAGLLAGAYKLWLWPELAVVTEIKQYPRLKALSLFLLGGELSEKWADREADIIAYGQLMGCTKIIGGGRKGWSGFAPKAGYTLDSYFFCKEI